MNKRTLLSILPAAALLLLSACTQDEPGGQGNELPYGEYPLQISGVTLDVESSAEPWSAEGPQTRVTEDNTDGKSSVWQWNGSEMIGVRLGNETATYTLNVGPSLTANKQLYWTSTAPTTVTAWYPTDETVNLSDQSNGLVYVLKATAENATYNNEITLSFKHQFAKVRVVLSGTQASLTQSVEVYGYTTCTNNEGATVTDNAQQGWLKMKNTTYADGTECWEANVVPGTIDKNSFLRLNGHAVLTESELSGFSYSTLEAANMYTIDLTVGEKITDIKDNTTISDNGYYRVSGIFDQPISITGGNPTIYLENANISVDNGIGINITDGSVALKVQGNNSVSSGNNTGIAVSNGATVTIEGNSTVDVLTVNGGSSGSGNSGTAGAGIGSPVGGTQGGNIIIRNVTVYATGGRGSSNVSGAGIGSSANGACGDITIEDAVIVATGGDCAAGIGMGCNYWNSTTGSIGKITITDSDVTASGGYGAAAIGFSLSEAFSGSGNTYRAGQITITTEDESGFLSKLTPGMNYVTTPQRIGKGSYNSTPTFLNTAGTGPWEGVVINGTAYPDGVQ